jgi:PAS domain S-box-containing protein
MTGFRAAAHTPGVSTKPKPKPQPGPGLPALGPRGQTGAQRRRLLEVAAALSWSLDFRAVAGQLVEAACATLGAPQGWVAVPSADGRWVELLASRGYPAGYLEPWSRVSVDLAVPMTRVILTGQAIFHDSARARFDDYPALKGEGMPVPVAEASAVVPMAFEGRTTGALAVTFRDVRRIDAGDRWFLESLAAQGSGALERARLFEEVREQGDRLRLALQASGTWIWEWDLATDEIAWTPEPPLAGTVRADGARAEDWLAAMHPEDATRVREVIEASLAAGSQFESEFRVLERDGGVRWFQGTGRVSRDRAGAAVGIVGTARDVTDRKLGELDRERRLDAEREAARLRDAFIGVVSHELRTPITTIFGGTRVLSRRWRGMRPRERDDILKDVSDEADRLYRLVEDLLVLTRVERGPLDVGDDPVSLRPILERVVATERVRWPEVELDVLVPPDLPSVRGEDTYVEQVLRNLVDNAAKYGGPGARVTLVAEEGPGEVSIRVLDEGPGIREDEADDLFDLFYRSPDVVGSVAGAGIGLFVCRQLVLAMDGRIHAERRPQGGTAFVVTLRRYGDGDEA